MSAYPSAFTNWVSDLTRDELIEILWERMPEDDKQELCADSELLVDDFDHPNIYPYKKCYVCEERSSCGNYDEDKNWHCEDCSDEEITCRKCSDPKVYTIKYKENDYMNYCATCIRPALKEELSMIGQECDKPYEDIEGNWWIFPSATHIWIPYTK